MIYIAHLHYRHTRYLCLCLCVCECVCGRGPPDPGWFLEACQKYTTKPTNPQDHRKPATFGYTCDDYAAAVDGLTILEGMMGTPPALGLRGPQRRGSSRNLRPGITQPIVHRKGSSIQRPSRNSNRRRRIVGSLHLSIRAYCPPIAQHMPSPVAEFDVGHGIPAPVICQPLARTVNSPPLTLLGLDVLSRY